MRIGKAEDQPVVGRGAGTGAKLHAHHLSGSRTGHRDGDCRIIRLHKPDGGPQIEDGTGKIRPRKFRSLQQGEVGEEHEQDRHGQADQATGRPPVPPGRFRRPTGRIFQSCKSVNQLQASCPP